VKWEPIETAPEGEELLLYYPAKYRNGAVELIEMVRLGSVGSTHREPTLWARIEWPAQSDGTRLPKRLRRAVYSR
jgi:hypothetical protein